MSVIPHLSLEEMAFQNLEMVTATVGNASNEASAGASTAHTGTSPKRLHRLGGPTAHTRHVGVMQQQHPSHHVHAGVVHTHKPGHPHHKAVAHVKTTHAHVDHGKTRVHKQQVGVHHGAHRTKASLVSAPGQLSLEVGTVVAYTAPTSSTAGSCSVVLQGSVAQLIPNLPITQCLPTDLVVLGAQCILARLDPANPADSLVVGVYNATPARRWQGDTTAVTVGAGLTQGNIHVTFPVAYAQIKSVVVSARVRGWVAYTQNVTTTGFDAYLQSDLAQINNDAAYNTPNPNNPSTPVVKTAGAIAGQVQAGGGGLTVTVDWIANGV